jgi:hypothetical protein
MKQEDSHIAVFDDLLEDATARSVFWSAYAVFITVIAVALAINLW